MQFSTVMTEAGDPVVRALDHWGEALFGRPPEHIASPKQKRSCFNLVEAL
jgi:hypothetical protein